MLFVIRGKSPDHHDRTLRVLAETEQEAEKIGWARGVFVTEVTPVDVAEIVHLKWLGGLIRAVGRRIVPGPMRCLGRPVSAGQSVALLIGGIATWVLDLRAFNML